ncbi:hemolysin family protein [Rhizobium sp. L1K21]|uniref:hemolysin family protein n=1 Tax=Rhizobium sp. L1K21 TaxID=2954933 RepID=UPI00209283A0|nr:hemolysin family protein [Rhizobium sp. L1K21]MCO6187423.1 hemolysin family protein [Rhizobium sp. L1K21]
MNENLPVPRDAAESKDEAKASSSEEPGSSSGAQRNGNSFWSRLLRLVRPTNGSSLRDDIADALLTDSESNTSFSPAERAMLHNILRFREVRVEDVMVPRADIDAVEQSTSVGELMSLFEETGRSRMPVYCETLDDPRGMVHIRDLLSWVMKQARAKRRAPRAAAGPDGEKAEPKTARPARTAGFDLSKADLAKPIAEAGITRQLLFVPPSMHAADLMALMQADRIQMALVIDEYGGTDGLVSHEDIVEMVVGDIWDEHDDDELMFRKTSDDVYTADARVELEELAEAIGPDFDIREQLEDVDTLGGLIFSALGRIPVRGELVNALPGFEFHILEADPRRVKRVRITRRRPAARRRTSKSEGETEPMSQQKRLENSSQAAADSSAK